MMDSSLWRIFLCCSLFVWLTVNWFVSADADQESQKRQQLSGELAVVDERLRVLALDVERRITRLESAVEMNSKILLGAVGALLLQLLADVYAVVNRSARSPPA